MVSILAGKLQLMDTAGQETNSAEDDKWYTSANGFFELADRRYFEIDVV